MNLVISIIIPMYNAEKYIKRCLESLQFQSYKKIEVIIVNDGSTDNGVKICDEFVLNDDRFILIHKMNGGVSSARNEGLKYVSGDFVLFLDADDWLEKNSIKSMVEVIERNNSDIVIFEYSVDYENGINKVCQHKELEGNLTLEEALFYTITPINRFACTKLFRKSILNNIDFNEQIHLGEDTLFACHAIKNSKSVYFLAEPLYHYFQSDNSATRSKKFNQRKLTGKIAYEEMVELCKQNYPTLEGVALVQYIELIMSVILDMYKNPKENKKHIQEYTDVVRRNARRIFADKQCTILTKLKVGLCCMHPLVMYVLRRKHD